MIEIKINEYTGEVVKIFSGNEICKYKSIEIYDSDGDYVVFFQKDIDCLIAALQKAKEVMKDG